VDRANLEVESRSITGLIGPNGAGKTTLFNLLSNFIRADCGQTYFEAQPIHHLAPYKIAQRGLVRTFQMARVVSRLSVLDNMLLAAPHQAGEHLHLLGWKFKQIRVQEQQHKAQAMEILNSVGLSHKSQDYAGSLSGGQRKLLELARVLMAQPKLVLLDEPAAGVNPTLIKQICGSIAHWRDQGMTFLIIEHNMDVVMSLCDWVWVMAEGRNLVDGAPQDIQTNPVVLSAYLGQGPEGKA
jgi:neutral amino acid transport system ATP-binding protein